MMLMILDMIIDVMMQEYPIQMTDTSTNRKKDQLFIPAGLWMDITTALMLVLAIAEAGTVVVKRTEVVMTGNNTGGSGYELTVRMSG